MATLPSLSAGCTNGPEEQLTGHLRQALIDHSANAPKAWEVKGLRTGRREERGTDFVGSQSWKGLSYSSRLTPCLVPDSPAISWPGLTLLKAA